MDKRLSELYNEERDKLPQLPCADDDFIAYEIALDRYSKEKKEK